MFRAKDEVGCEKGDSNFGKREIEWFIFPPWPAQRGIY